MNLGLESHPCSQDSFVTSPYFCPGELVISTFIGASFASTDVRRTLRRLCHELARAAGNIEALPLGIEDLITHFHKLLAECAGRRRVILVWLPRELPPGARIVASVISPGDGQPEHQTLAILRTRPGIHIARLELLIVADARAIIESYLRRFAKRLSQDQLTILLAKPSCRLPLYILIVLGELRTLGRYDEITDRIRAFPGDIRSLLGWILEERYARDPSFRDSDGRPCGSILAARFGACLAVSRRGLSELELTAILDPGDPSGNVAALLRLVRPYLTLGGDRFDRFDRFDFSLGQLREAAEAAYLNTVESHRAAHAALAKCFNSFADSNGDETWLGTNQVAFTELPFHLVMAESFHQWVQVMTSFGYLNAVVAKVGLSTGTTEEGETFQSHDGYYIIRDELEKWADYRSQIASGIELITPLLQVWGRHEIDFLTSDRLVMATLYRDLKAMQPKQAFDRATRKIIRIEEGPISIWCERERKKHEKPSSPWEEALPPFEAYAGDEPFVFVSYSHKDSGIVYPEIDRLHRSGFRIWYDEGIDPGNEWPEEVANALARCVFFLVFISPRSVESANVRNEINFAINRKKPFLAIHVEETLLPTGLELRMGDIQAVLKWRMPDDRYHRQMAKSLPDSLKLS